MHNLVHAYYFDLQSGWQTEKYFCCTLVLKMNLRFMSDIFIKNIVINIFHVSRAVI